MQHMRRDRVDRTRKSAVSSWFSPANGPIRDWRARCSWQPREMRTSRTPAVRRAAGFTLVELMITVAIIGVLALLATVGYARWVRTAKTAEATAMLGSIKGAQETWRAEHLNYNDASGGTLNNEYPLVAPTDSKVAWNPKACAGTAICDRLRALNVQAESAVYYRYAVVAGPATGTAVAFDGRTFSPAAHDPWFVARARGDLDANGVQSRFWTSSFDTTILSDKPGE